MSDLWEYRARANLDLADPIVDGDTIDLRVDLGFDVDGLGMRARLLGVDCPEKRTDPAGWLDAKLYTANWLAEHADAKGRVFVRSVRANRRDRTERDKADSFGRYLVQVYTLVDGDTQGDRCLNTDLRTSGHAVEYQG